MSERPRCHACRFRQFGDGECPLHDLPIITLNLDAGATCNRGWRSQACLLKNSFNGRSNQNWATRNISRGKNCLWGILVSRASWAKVPKEFLTAKGHIARDHKSCSGPAASKAPTQSGTSWSRSSISAFTSAASSMIARTSPLPARSTSDSAITAAHI